MRYDETSANYKNEKTRMDGERVQTLWKDKGLKALEEKNGDKKTGTGKKIR
jgi:hypothetical protein